MDGDANESFFSFLSKEVGCVYMYYIHPELRILDYPSGSGKGAGLL